MNSQLFASSDAFRSFRYQAVPLARPVPSRWQRDRGLEHLKQTWLRERYKSSLRLSRLRLRSWLDPSWRCFASPYETGRLMEEKLFLFFFSSSYKVHFSAQSSVGILAHLDFVISEITYVETEMGWLIVQVDPTNCTCADNFISIPETTRWKSNRLSHTNENSDQQLYWCLKSTRS